MFQRGLRWEILGQVPLGPGREEVTVADWPPSAGDPGGPDGGFTSCSVGSWGQPQFTSLSTYKQRAPRGLGCRQTFSVPMSLGGLRASALVHNSVSQVGLGFCPVVPQGLGSPEGLQHLCPLVSRVAGEGVEDVAPGTAGHSCTLRTLSQPRPEHRVRRHSFPAWAPLQKARPRDSVSWGLAGPRPSLTKERWEDRAPNWRNVQASSLEPPPQAGCRLWGRMACWPQSGRGGSCEGLRASGALRCGSHLPAQEPPLGSEDWRSLSPNPAHGPL